MANNLKSISPSTIPATGSEEDITDWSKVRFELKKIIRLPRGDEYSHLEFRPVVAKAKTGWEKQTEEEALQKHLAKEAKLLSAEVV